MKITFFSNFLNHHQLPFCLELINYLGEGDFRFVACEPIHEERVQMGYEDMNVIYPFVLRAYETEEAYREAIRLAESSEVVIIGSADAIFTQIRAKNNKLTFLYRERIFKNGTLRRFFPTTAWKIYNGYTRYRNKNFYILCASAYAADDFALCGFPRLKCLKWGYFPAFKKYERNESQCKKLRLMWCGRMIWWKHPEHAIEVARILKERNVDFEMIVVGNGEKEAEVINLIDRYQLANYIELRGFMSPDEIRMNMERSDVYLFTSGREEGWGVVLNEAMNSRCAVLANTCAGSTNYLLNEECGFLYDGTISSLEVALDKLLQSNIILIGDKAYERIKNSWSPEKATSNLINFVKKYYEPASEGPCSLA